MFQFKVFFESTIKLSMFLCLVINNIRNFLYCNRPWVIECFLVVNIMLIYAENPASYQFKCKDPFKAVI